MAEIDLTKMTSSELVDALIADNSLVSQFDTFSLWELIENKDWQKLVLERPTFYKKMSGIAWFGASEWVELIIKNKNFIDICTKWDAFSKEDWLRLLPTIDEKYLKKCKCWKNFSPDNWVDILIRYPNLATKCKSFDSFKEKQWNILLSKQPNLWVYSEKESRKKIMQTGVVSDGLSLKSLSVYDWKKLIKQNPKNFEKLNSLKIFSIDDCIELLQLKDKAIIEKFDKWADLRKVDWDKLDTEVLKEYAKKYKNGRRSLLERHPAYLKAKKSWSWWREDPFPYSIALTEDFSIIEYIEDIQTLDTASWEVILNTDKRYLSKCPIKSMSPHNAVRLISIEESLFEKYDTSKFKTGDWATLIKQNPKFADKCTTWDFTPTEWREILKVAPQLIEKCNCLDWISTYFLAEHCEKYQILEKYIPSKSVEKIKQDPTFIRECKCKNKISSTDWFDLLNTYPQLREYCDCYLNFTNDESIELIKLDIAFADNVLVNHKFDDAEEQRILAVDPNLWKYLPQISVNEIIKDASKLEECKCVDKFSMQNWEDIVNAYPTFKSNEYYQRFFPPTRSRKSVSIKPSTRVKIPELDEKIIKKFGKNNDVFWAVKKLIQEDPTLESKLLGYKVWKKFNWCELLKKIPSLYIHCPILDKFHSRDWADIINANIEIAYLTDIWQSPSRYSNYNYTDQIAIIANILLRQKDLIKIFKCWHILSEPYCDIILFHYPEYYIHFGLSTQKKSIFKNSHLWKYPTLESYYKALENKKETYLNQEWESALKQKRWEFNVRVWEDILSIRPEFSDKCNKWGWITPEALSSILSAQPQFADKCTKCKGWEKFGSANWLDLLKAQPQFADKCPDKIYDQFSEENWRALEAKHPGVFEDKHMLSTLRKLARD